MADLKLKNVVTDPSNESEKSDRNDLQLPLERLNLGPRRKLLVLCLGGLLVNRVHAKHWTRVEGLNPDLRFGNFVVFKRPFCAEFMRFCFERFEVGIWSGTTERYTDAIIDIVPGSEIKMINTHLATVDASVEVITPNTEVTCYTRHNKLLARGNISVGQEECIDSGIQCLRKRLKPLLLKDLRQLWDKKYLDLPWRRGQYSWSNTLLICVDPPTSLLNPPNTSIFPHPYKRHDAEDTFLGPNGELRGYLERLVDVDSVPTYVKEHPFGQPAITPSHPDWNYYAKVVREFSKTENKKYA